LNYSLPAVIAGVVLILFLTGTTLNTSGEAPLLPQGGILGNLKEGDLAVRRGTDEMRPSTRVVTP
jgi:hypothetical protein